MIAISLFLKKLEAKVRINILDFATLTDRKPIFTGIFGILCFFVSPPFFFFPTLLSFPIVWHMAMNDKNTKRGFQKLFWFMYFYFLSVLNWFFTPFTIELKHWLLIPLCAPLMPIPICILAMFFNAPMVILAKRQKNIVLKYILISIGWSMFEFCKSHFLVGGLPLANISLILTKWDSAIQIASMVTQSQLDTIVTFMVFLPFFYTKSAKSGRIAVVIGTFLIMANATYGNNMVKKHKMKYVDGSSFPNKLHKIIGIQGNVPQKLISSASGSMSSRIKILQTYYNFSKKYIKPSPTSIVVWPEGAVIYYDSQEDVGFLSEIKDLIQEQGIMLFPSIVSSHLLEEGRQRFYNTTTVINQYGDLIGRFNKRHLVPFGEYIPLRFLIPKFIQTVAGIGDLDHKKQEVRFIWINGLAIMPTICYDSFFDDIYKDSKGNKPDIIINMTNTGWIGNSIGFYQHFFALKLRAIRNGIPIINVANSQGSVFIDEIGRFIKTLPNKEMSAIDICVFSKSPNLYHDRSKGRFFKFAEC